MLYGKELDEALTVLPPYDPNIIHADAATRLVALSDIYRLFLSNPMAREIYSKLFVIANHQLFFLHTYFRNLLLYYRLARDIQSSYYYCCF